MWWTTLRQRYEDLSVVQAKSILVALLLLLNAVGFAVAWEQPDCAASMECRDTTTIPEALNTIATQWSNMEVVISYIGSTDTENFNHVSDIQHSTTEGITLSFEGPDGDEYGTTTVKGFDGDHKRAYVKSVDKEDHEQ